MVKIIRIISFCFAIILTIAAGVVFFKRWMLPYNSEGNYYDPANAINYHKQDVVLYAILFGFCILVTIGFFLAIIKSSSIKTGLQITVKETTKKDDIDLA